MNDFKDVSEDYEKEAVASAPYRAQSKLAKRYLEQKLAVLTQQKLVEGAGSVSKAQVEAMASQEYKKALNKMSTVIATGQKSLAKMRAMELKHEWQRSMNSLEKKKANIL
jgi:hypothetical protein